MESEKTGENWKEKEGILLMGRRRESIDKERSASMGKLEDT